jgi:hypothetical protein
MHASVQTSAIRVPYRDRYRAEKIPRRYSGVLHLCATFTLGLGIIIWAILHLHDVRAVEWLTVPITFIIANLGEYHFHRRPMHHRRAYAKMLYERHMNHHAFYTVEAMAAESTRDYHIVLFPPWVLAVVLFYVAPVALLFSLFFPHNVPFLFAITAMTYFLNYELLHFAYHQPAGSFLRRIPGVERLSRLHTVHHDPALMATHNFNITYPIADWIFGTWKGANS